MRDKVKILFNKRSVKITKTILGKSNKDDKQRVLIDFINFQEYYRGDSTKKTRHRSPLGFWYWKKEKPPVQKETTTKVIKFITPREVTEISYLTTYNDARIGPDLRPWNLGSDSSSITDHQLDALNKVVEEMLGEIETLKRIEISFASSPYQTFPISYTPHEFKTELLQDLFEGLSKPQNDKEKIISHGFDTRPSFRG